MTWLFNTLKLSPGKSLDFHLRPEIYYAGQTSDNRRQGSGAAKSDVCRRQEVLEVI